MQMKITASLAVLLSGLMVSSPAWSALTQPSRTQTENQTFTFIQNDVDGEFFISPDSLNPRFAGPNVWTKYNQGNQESLGYMGIASRGITSSRYGDYWLSSPSIAQPFLGLRCLVNNSNCPAAGFTSPEALDEKGIYKLQRAASGETGGYPLAIFSNGAYNYFRNMGVHSSVLLKYNFCYTSDNYNAAAGERCIDTNGISEWTLVDYTVYKEAHITLRGTNALAEIFVDSNGNPSVTAGAQQCAVTNVDGQTGISCRMIDYDFQGSLASNLYISPVLNEALAGFSVSGSARSTLQIGDGNSNWAPIGYGDTTSRYRADRFFTNGGKGVYLFLGQAFLKRLIENGIDVKSTVDLFTFLFRNANLPNSGYYEFTPSTRLIIKPRNYGISILSKDMSMNPSAEGRVGGNEPPIEFEYQVTVSGPRQANKITAQVVGDGEMVNGQSYCIFTGSSHRVAFPAYLYYRRESGDWVSRRNSCIEEPIDMTDALWVETPWDVPYQDEGRFYRTDLQLKFPMNDPVSQFSRAGEDWIGVVSATGEVRVTATWTGVED